MTLPTVLLSLGDGATTGALDLMAAPYKVLRAGVTAPPPAPGAATREVRVPLRLTGTSSDTLSDAAQALEWRLIEAERAAGAIGRESGTTGVTLYVKYPLGTMAIYFDVLSGRLERSGAGMIANGWEDYTLVLSCLPLARGNALTISNLASGTDSFGAAAWTATRCSVVADDAAAPDGSTTADKLVEDSSASTTHFLRQSLTTVADTVYTTSVYAKADERVGLRIALDNGSVSQGSADFNLTLGTVHLSSGVTAAIEDVGDGWYRCSVTDSHAGTTTRVFLNLLEPVGTASYSGDGASGLHLWGFQVEAAATAGPLLLTGSGTPTITNGNGGWIHLYGLPGDEPGLTQIRATDVSTTSTFINRSRWGQRSRRGGQALGVFDAILDQTSNSPGADTTTDPNRVGSNYAAVTSSQSWQDIADFSGAATSKGLFDLWVRCRTNAAVVGAPTNLAYTQSNAGSLTVDRTYQIKVVTLDGSGNLSAATDAISVPVTSTAVDRIALAWTVGANAANHRVYFKTSGNNWSYFATGSALGSYNFDTVTGATNGAPPDSGSGATALPFIRALAGMSSLTTTHMLPTVPLAIGNDSWELVKVGTVALPPIPSGEGLADQAWKVTVQGKSGGTNTPTIDVDAAWLFPHDEPQMVAEYRGLTLAALRQHVIDVRRDGRVSALLRNTSTEAEAGQLTTRGAFYLAPPSCLVLAHFDGVGGVSDVVDLKAQVAFRYVPRYRWIPGATG